MRGKCAWCGSGDVQVGLDLFYCLTCGEVTDSYGSKVPPEPQFLAPSWQERKAAGEVQ